MEIYFILLIGILYRFCYFASHSRLEVEHLASNRKVEGCNPNLVLISLYVSLINFVLSNSLQDSTVVRDWNNLPSGISVQKAFGPSA